VPGDFACGPRLHELLDRGLDMPLTLVSAPAGYGKRLLVSQWVAAQNVPCAWLSLDSAGSPIDIFVDYLLAAVETAVPDACPPTQPLAQAAQPPPLSALAGSPAK
jgi:LuxR family maltose regulon positive regulatory protein